MVSWPGSVLPREGGSYHLHIVLKLPIHPSEVDGTAGWIRTGRGHCLWKRSKKSKTDHVGNEKATSFPARSEQHSQLDRGKTQTYPSTPTPVPLKVYLVHEF